MKLKLTRKQELYLIDLGLAKLLEVAIEGGGRSGEKSKEAKAEGKKKRWSPEQRRKFRASMKKVWDAKKAEQAKKAS